MRSPWGIYIVAALSTVYSLLTVVAAIRTAGQLWPGVFAVLLLIGAIGLFLKQPWARFSIYAFSVAVVPPWVVYTIWFIRPSSSPAIWWQSGFASAAPSGSRIRPARRSSGSTTSGP